VLISVSLALNGSEASDWLKTWVISHASRYTICRLCLKPTRLIVWINLLFHQPTQEGWADWVGFVVWLTVWQWAVTPRLAISLAQTFHSAAAGADPGICERGPIPPVPFLSPSSLPFPSLSTSPHLRIMAPLTTYRVWESAVSSPSGVRGRAPAKTNLVHSKAVKSHWWQSFWILWVPCFTVERSKFSIS